MKVPISLVLLLNVVALALPTTAAAAEPSGYEYFHTYAEVKAEIDQTVASHPGIAKRFSIGRSYEGRKIWGIKISDNVAADENEPEVFIHAQIHARERATNELALEIVKWLTDNYGGTDAFGQRTTDIVNSREIFIVPTMNPDGAEFDMQGGTWREWRKNRQPIPNSTAIGVDLNRQFGYQWGCCGGGSLKPKSPTYVGPSAWYAPEARRYRDFVDSRVINGEQQLKVILSLHSAGRLVLWPYSYTKQDVPPEMSQDDHAAFVALGMELAAMNGYRGEQASDLYLVRGDHDDWAHYAHGIFTLTFEMARGAAERYYPTPSELATDINNNRPAVIHLLEQADCTYRSAGLAAQYC